MKSRIRPTIIIVIFIGLLASIAWTYFSIKSQPMVDAMPDVTLSVIPEYQIVSGTDLMVWPKGTFFEQGRAAYFYSAEPEVTITPIIKVAGMDQGLIHGTLKSQVYIQSIDDKSQTYWSYKLKESPLKEFTLSEGSNSLGNQSTFQAPGLDLDVPAAYSAVIQIGNELLFQNGIFQMLVISNITVSGTANGMPIERSITHTLPIILQQISFTIPKSEEIITEVSFTDDSGTPSLTEALIEVVRFNQIPFIINFVLLLLLLILVIINEVHKPKAAKEHLRFKEWITEGSVEVKDRLSIHILTLEGLVDLAIDLDKRVLYDAKVNRYYVLAEDIVYIHDSERSHAILENKQP